MLSYGAKLVRDNYITGPDLLAFIIYQLTLGGVLSVSIDCIRRAVLNFPLVGYLEYLYVIDVGRRCQSIGVRLSRSSAVAEAEWFVATGGIPRRYRISGRFIGLSGSTERDSHRGTSINRAMESRYDQDACLERIVQDQGWTDLCIRGTFRFGQIDMHRFTRTFLRSDEWKDSSRRTRDSRVRSSVST